MVTKFLSLHIAKPFVYILLFVCLGTIGLLVINMANDNTLLSQEIAANQAKIAKLSIDNLTLAHIIQSREVQTNSLKSSLQDITDQVNTLEKIKDTDKELLAKYSKVFFLNENYVPRVLADIPSTMLVPNSKQLQIHGQVFPFLEKLILASREANNPIQIVSAYRSFNTQASLKSAYKSVFGSGANKFSADQGYSEHQLGTAVDLTTPILKDTFVSFEKTPAYKWLQDNAYKYGFALSYPKGNKYYVYEPWHWRFVGVALATKLHNDDKYFYDLDQRDINDYLLNIFEAN